MGRFLATIDDSDEMVLMLGMAEDLQMMFDPSEPSFLWDHVVRNGYSDGYKFVEYRKHHFDWAIKELGSIGNLVFSTGDGYEWHCIWMPRYDQYLNIYRGGQYKSPIQIITEIHRLIYIWQPGCGTNPDIPVIIEANPLYEQAATFDQFFLALVMDTKFNKKWDRGTKTWIFRG